jgi:AcrR family transcriptional regulator
MESTEPKWKRLPDERPAQILDAALDVFASKGFQAATMQEVAEAAGITKGTIYLYFPGKTELFLATVRAPFREAIALLPKIDFKPGDDPEQRTRELGKAFLDVLMTPKVAKVLPLIVAEYGHLPQMRSMYFEEFFTQADLHVAGLIGLGRQLGLVRDVDPNIAARILLGSYVVFVLTQEVLGAKDVTPMSTEAIAETIATVFFRGVLQAETRI